MLQVTQIRPIEQLVDSKLKLKIDVH